MGKGEGGRGKTHRCQGEVNHPFGASMATVARCIIVVIRGAIRAAPAAVADQGAGGAAGRRPAGHLGDHPRVAERLSVARCATRLWPLEDAVQSVRALGPEGGLGAGLHGAGTFFALRAFFYHLLETNAHQVC